jgi:hypothetical protein
MQKPYIEEQAIQWPKRRKKAKDMHIFGSIRSLELVL